jgi:O-antigen/teichoic acid export membrane protein
VFAVVCGRTLGIHDYGIVAFYSSLAAFLGMFVEFGFDWYGIREVAQNQGDPQRCHRVLFNITAARLLLSAGVFVVIWPGAAVGAWGGGAAADGGQRRLHGGFCL